MSNESKIVRAATIPGGGRLLPADSDAYQHPAYRSGQDIIVPSTLATCFGGPSDSGDDGRTASGIRTDKPGGVAGCSLPMPSVHACDGTPFPVFPWGTRVEVTFKGHSITVPLIDVGPSRKQHPCRLIDLTPLAVSQLIGESYDPELANSWGEWVAFRILAVARYLTDYRPRNADFRADAALYAS